MYNDPRAKDLLAQYPRQLAEGGAVDQPFQAPAVAPRGAPLPAAAANQSLAVAPRQRPVLAPVTPTLSMSQQFARDRAAQDAMIRDAIRNTGVTNPSTMDYRQLQRAVRAGDINAENIKQKFVDPELEARVRNAYAAIGRTGGVVPALEMPKQGGATADTYKQVRQDEFNYFADQLKQGKISPTDFQNAFLTKTATDIPATDLEAQRAYINNARKALGLADLEVPKPQNTGSYIGFGQYGGMGGMGGTQNQYNIGSIAGPKFTPTAPKLPTQPIDLSGTGSTPVQLFNAGGEAVADQTPRSMDLEQFLLENSRAQVGPVDVQEVRSARGPGKYDTRISKDEGGFQAFADVDVGDKKLSQLGARFMGRGRIGNYEVQYVFDPETKQPVITGAVRKELSPTSDVSAEGVYVPQKDGKDYYNAGIRYTKRFEDGGEVTNENVRTLKSIDVTPEDKPEKSRVKENLDAIMQGLKDEDISAKDVALFINSFIPVSGDIQSAAEGYQAFKDKDYLGAGLGAAGALPLVPNITKYVKASPKDMDKFFEEMADSKIRDAEGKLATVYHGGAGLEEGLPTKGTGIFSEGVYFSGIPSRTRYYGEKAKNGTTFPMYANLKNPISSEEFTKRFGTANPKNSKAIRDTLVAEGYDGVLSKSGDKIWEGVSFFPENQLKSSISSITPKMKDEMLKEDIKAFNKYAHGGEVSKFIKSKK